MTTKLPAPLALKKYIVQQANDTAYRGFNYSGPLETEQQIEDAYEHTIDKDLFGIKNEVRHEGFETDLPAPISRHYECEVRALKTDDGWIGYNFWHGGGKHGSPECIDWIGESYYLTREEKEVLTIQRTWAKVVD
jgi:hypothetical protein